MSKWSFKKFVVGAAAAAVVLCAGMFVVGCSDDSNPADSGGDGGGDEITRELTAEERLLWELELARFSNSDGVTIVVPSGIPSEDGLVTTGGVARTFVGYGVNVFKGPTFVEAITVPLFADEVYENMELSGGNRYIGAFTANSIVSTSSVSENLSEVYSKLDVAASTRTGSGVPFFSGGVQAQFGTSSELKSEARFYNSYFHAETARQTLNAVYRLNLNSVMSDSILLSINNSNIHPELLFEVLGTHVITSHTKGGHVNMTGLYNSSDYSSTLDVSVALDFKTSWVQGEANTSLSERQREIATNTQLKIIAQGGSVAPFAGATIEVMNAALNEWAASLNPDNETMAKIHAMVPIWELATDLARRQELESYFYTNADRINLELMDYFSRGLPALPEPPLMDGALYNIVHWYSDRLLGGGSGDNNVDVFYEVADGNGRDRQWRAIESKEHRGYFRLVHMSSDRVLTAVNNRTYHLYNYDAVKNNWTGSDFQLWRAVENTESRGRVSVTFRNRGLELAHDFHINVNSSDSARYDAWLYSHGRGDGAGVIMMSAGHNSLDNSPTHPTGKWTVERLKDVR